MRRKQRQWNAALFLLYGAVMAWLLFGRDRFSGELPYWVHVSQHINLVPFHTIRLFAHQLVDPIFPGMVYRAANNLVGNVILFIPLGYFLPVTWQPLRRFYRTLLTVVTVITMVELLQLLLQVGACDIDDLMLNTIGAAIGYGFFRLLFPKLV